MTTARFLKNAFFFAYNFYRDNLVLCTGLLLIGTAASFIVGAFLSFLSAPFDHRSAIVTTLYNYAQLSALTLYYYIVIMCGLQALHNKPVTVSMLVNQSGTTVGFILARLWLLLKIAVLVLPVTIIVSFMKSIVATHWTVSPATPMTSSTIVLTISPATAITTNTIVLVTLVSMLSLAAIVGALLINLIYFFSGFFIADHQTDSVWQDARMNRYFIKGHVIKVSVLFACSILFETILFQPRPLSLTTVFTVMGCFLALTLLYLAITYAFHFICEQKTHERILND